MDRPLILGYTGDITAPIGVDQLLTVTFSIPVETLTAQIIDFYGVGVHLDFEVSLDPTREVATLFDPAGDFPAYDLGVQGVTLTGTAFSGEAISSTIQVYTPDGMNIVATNVFGPGGFYNPALMNRLYDEPEMVIDFPLTGGIITFDFDQPLLSVIHAELYEVDTVSPAIIGAEVNTTATVAGSTLTLTVNDTLVEDTITDYFVAFEVTSTRPNDGFETVLNIAVLPAGAGDPAAESRFPAGIAYLAYEEIYGPAAGGVGDEYVRFSTEAIRILTANVYDDSGSEIVIYTSPTAITPFPENDFPAASDIDLTFTRNLDLAEANDFKVIDSTDNSEVPLNAPVIVANVVTIDPVANLIPGRQYQLQFTVFAAPLDTSSNQLDFIVTGPIPSFSLVDANIGTVSYTAGVLDPIAAVGATLGVFTVVDDIRLVFDEALNNVSANQFVELYTISGIDLSIDTYDLQLFTFGTTTVTDDTLIINPTDDLDPDVVYNLRFNALSAAGDNFLNEDASMVEISFAFRTSNAPVVAPVEDVTGFIVLTNAGDVDAGGLIDWDAKDIEVEWNRVSNPTSLTRYYFYADIVDAAGAVTYGSVPLILDDDADLVYDTYFINDTDNTTFAEKQVTVITAFAIDLARSINNHFEDILGNGVFVDTGGLFTYGTRVNLFMTASDSIGVGESVTPVAAGGAVPLLDAVLPAGSIGGTLPTAGNSATLTFSANEDMAYVDPTTLVTEIGTNQGAGGVDFTIDSVTWVDAQTIDIAVTLNLAVAVGDGIQVDYFDTTGNGGASQTLTY